jgi:valyl-tRNA synthetase
MSIEKKFDPGSFEARWAERWEAAEIFQARPADEGPMFSLVIPPPNVTGALHIGHALDYTLQDVLTRWHRMLGHDTVLVPGSDHAGIATQSVVERHLREGEGTTRHALGREEFVERVWQWKKEYHGRIVGTLRRLGYSADWSRERFTLDEGLSRAVREVFVRLHGEGLIYRATSLINWCPDCRTALSDLEVNRDQPEPGEMWSFAYPVEGGGEIVVATTRPETMLGDTAVAVHPEDDRYRGLIGRRVAHPFFPDREIPIIADALLADPETGTGAVKVTPAHDPNDFACGKRNGLAEINILEPDATLGEAAGPYAGLDRYAARERVKEDLRERGLERGSEEHSYAPGRCQRCSTVVESMISTQWFVRMEPLAAPALEAVRDGRIRFVPETWSKTYFHWLENIEDWCISRQLWWGHRIPAWYCECGETHVAREAPGACAACGGTKLRQDEDVLDTWFSSALWPFTVFGWPEETADLRRYYPTSVLVTGFDIIFFWVARMIMMGLHVKGEIPFRTVYYHGLVRDEKGAKMSKSTGNAVDPAEVMDEYGVDALRFTLGALASPGSDLKLSTQRLEGYRAFLTKLWNATRFVLLNLREGTERLGTGSLELGAEDRWLLSRAHRTAGRVDDLLHEYRFDRMTETVYHFVWRDLCDWYIEWVKEDLSGRSGNEERRGVVEQVLLEVLDLALRLVHPVAPFVTEELWQRLPRGSSDPQLLAVASYPRGATALVDPDLEAALETEQEVAALPRWVRAFLGLPPRQVIPLWVEVSGLPEGPAGYDTAEALGRVSRVAGAEARVVESLPAPGGGWIHLPSPWGTVALQAGDGADTGELAGKLTARLSKLDGELASRRKKLENPRFVERAPEEVVEKERGLVAELEAERERLGAVLSGLGAGS